MGVGGIVAPRIGYSLGVLASKDPGRPESGLRWAPWGQSEVGSKRETPDPQKQPSYLQDPDADEGV